MARTDEYEQVGDGNSDPVGSGTAAMDEWKIAAGSALGIDPGDAEPRHLVDYLRSIEPLAYGEDMPSVMLLSSPADSHDAFSVGPNWRIHCFYSRSSASLLVTLEGLTLAAITVHMPTTRATAWTLADEVQAVAQSILWSGLRALNVRDLKRKYDKA